MRYKVRGFYGTLMASTFWFWSHVSELYNPVLGFIFLSHPNPVKRFRVRCSQWLFEITQFKLSLACLSPNLWTLFLLNEAIGNVEVKYAFHVNQRCSVNYFIRNRNVYVFSSNMKCCWQLSPLATRLPMWRWSLPSVRKLHDNSTPLICFPAV